MRATLAAIAASAALIGGAGEAAACSLEFVSWLGTPSGAAIPRAGTLYAMVPGGPLDEETGAEWTARSVTSLAAEVMAIEYRATGPALEITARARWSLPSDEQWEPPAEPPQVVATWHLRRIGCGATELLALQLDQPVAAAIATRPARRWCSSAMPRTSRRSASTCCAPAARWRSTPSASTAARSRSAACRRGSPSTTIRRSSAPPR